MAAKIASATAKPVNTLCSMDHFIGRYRYCSVDFNASYRLVKIKNVARHARKLKPLFSPPQHLQIHRAIRLGAALPTEVLGHAVFAQRLPFGLVVVEADRALYRGIQICGGHAVERKAAGAAVLEGFRRAVHHRIRQPADGMDDWQCAVTLAV